MMLLTMLVFAVTAAACGYLARALREGDRQSQWVFILMTLAGPMLVMVVVSIVWSLTRRR
jgi:hypothetical protein